MNNNSHNNSNNSHNNNSSHEINRSANVSASMPSTGGGATLPSIAGGGIQRTNVPTGTLTITEQSALPNQEVLPLSLTARPGVRWDQDVVDNEGLGRKSSKRCCIFHKQKAFGESSTDSSDCDSAASDDDSKPAAIRKNGEDKVPDSQRYHA